MVSLSLPLLLLSARAADPSPVPDREIPGEVLVDLQDLGNRFELALAADCPADQCYSNGCVYVDHAVSDRPRNRSLPGLGEEAGPGSVAAQAWLTRATCSFAHEPTVDAADAAAMVRRLQTRMTSGWTVVSVSHQALPAIPSTVAPPEEPPAEEPPPPPPVEPPTWSQELWAELLPHAWWMVGIGLLTGATVALIWAGRRVGRASIEEQALLASLNQPGGEPAAPEAVAVEEEAPAADERDYVAQQEAAWKARLSAMTPDDPDPALVALVRDRLRAGDLSLLAKAVLRFPEHFPAVFPVDGETATAKLELAEVLRTVDAAALPADAAFFRALERHALAATLATQPDARVVRDLREDVGAIGLVTLIGQQPPRVGALLFALAPAGEQHEAARLLPEAAVEALCRQLLLSNRVDPGETAAILAVIEGARGASRPAPAEISDRGATFDAPGALAVLLPRLPAARRAALFDEALGRFHGALPQWHRDIFVGDMLLVLEAEARADLLLGVEVEALASWLSVQDPALAARLLESCPESLRLSVQAVGPGASRALQLARATAARRAMAAAFQRQLARAGLPFERVVRAGAPA